MTAVRLAGQGSIEAMMMLLRSAVLFAGLFESNISYHAEQVCNAANFEVAQIGALHGADVSMMKAELANGRVNLVDAT